MKTYKPSSKVPQGAEEARKEECWGSGGTGCSSSALPGSTVAGRDVFRTFKHGGLSLITMQHELLEEREKCAGFYYESEISLTYMYIHYIICCDTVCLSNTKNCQRCHKKMFKVIDKKKHFVLA